MNHFVIGHRARQWFTQCSTGQSGTQWTQTPPGSLAPSDYWRMLEIWSQTNWNILRGWTEQLSAPPETWKHSEIQGQKTSSLRTKWLHLKIQIYNRKTQTKGNAVITWAQSLEYSINMINTPSVVLKETKKSLISKSMWIVIGRASTEEQSLVNLIPSVNIGWSGKQMSQQHYQF